MKITRLESIPINVPLKPRFAIRSGRGGAHTTSPFLLVIIHTDEGLTGVGEASCTPRWSGEDQVTAAHLIHAYLEPLLVGENPLDTERLTQKFRLAFAANFFTKAAVEMALWDIAGKACGQPVWRLLAGSSPNEPAASRLPGLVSSPSSPLEESVGERRSFPAPVYGGRIRQIIPTKWSVSGLEPDAAAAIAGWAVAQGFGAMKVKVGLDPDADVARVAAVRAAIGPQTKLGVDANGGWSAAVALRTIQRLSAHSIYFVEQPVPPEDITDMANLRRQLKLPVVADESVFTLQDARMVALAGAADVLSVYIGKAGGIGPARRIIEFAQCAGLKCTLGSNLELGLGSAAMVHLATAMAGLAVEEFPCDIIGPFFYEDDVVRDPQAIAPGRARANDRPGLGVELDEEKVDKYRVR